MTKLIILTTAILFTLTQISYSQPTKPQQVPEVVQKVVGVKCLNPDTLKRVVNDIKLKLIAFGKVQQPDRILSLWITPKNGFIVINSSVDGLENCVMANIYEANTIEPKNN